jgi:LCP family protein required for cell wall assembly
MLKKILSLSLLSLFLLTGCGKEEVVTEPEPEPIPEPVIVDYSEPMYIISLTDSSIKSIDDLAGKRVAVQAWYEKQYSDYIIEELSKIDSLANNIEFIEYDSYKDAGFDIFFDKIDAFILNSQFHELLEDFYPLYDTDSTVHIVETYEIPIYEEDYYEDKEGQDSYVFNTPFVFSVNGVDKRGDVDIRSMSDVNFMVAVNPITKHITTVNFPRDSYIKNSCSGYKDKMTHFGPQGPECVGDSMAEAIGVERDYFVQVNFKTFVDFINIIGGVELEVPLDFCLDQNSERDVSNPVCLDEGEQHLFGEQLLALSRNRKYGGVYGGDWGRIRNQQLVASSIIDRFANHPVLVDLASLKLVHNTLIYHDLDDDNVSGIAALMKEFSKGYTIDNFFIDTTHGRDANDLYIGVVNKRDLEIARLKMELTLNSITLEDVPESYYDEVISGYINLGAGDYSDKYLGEDFDLTETYSK